MRAGAALPLLWGSLAPLGLLNSPGAPATSPKRDALCVEHVHHLVEAALLAGFLLEGGEKILQPEWLIHQHLDRSISYFPQGIERLHT